MAFRALRPLGASATGRGTFNVQEFRGLDKVSGEDNFSPYRAADLENFIRDKIGQVKKRGGFSVVNYGKDIRWVDLWRGYRFEYTGSSLCYEKIEEGSMQITMRDEEEDLMVVTSAIGFAAGGDYYLLYCDNDNVYRVTKFSINDEDESVKKNTVELAIGPVMSNSISGIEGAELPDKVNKNALSSALNKKYSYNVGPSKYIPVPVIVSAADPEGGGDLMQSPNLLSPYVQETFSTKAGVKRFQLSMQDIALYDPSGEPVSAEEWADGGIYWETNTEGYGRLKEDGAAVLNASLKVEVYTATGTDDHPDYEWKTKTGLFEKEKAGFVNPKNGGVWIPSADIGVAPVEGEPNVRITYIRNQDSYLADLKLLFSATNVTTYGVGGYKDRVFLSVGNRIYYSGMDEPMYFGELNYVEPCPSDRTIVAMGGQGKYLYAVDSEGVSYAIGGAVAEDNTAAFARDASFVILDHVQGEKPVGNILDVFGDEFCYLSEMGLVAIRHDDFYDKRYAQNRSRMLGELLKGKRLCACRWGSFMVIGAEDRLYLLDEMQQSTLPDCKYSGKQYEAYVFTFDKAFLAASGVAVNDTVAPVDYESEESEPTQLPTYISKVWTEGDSLKVCAGGKIWTYDPEGKADLDAEGNKYPITAVWVTPKLSLSSFYRKKIIHRLALTLGGEMCSVRLEYRTDNREDWTVLREYDGRFYVFDYGAINYGFWTYRGEVSRLQLIINRRPSRKFNKIQFKFTNANEDGLSLAEFGIVYETEVL